MEFLFVEFRKIFVDLMIVISVWINNIILNIIGTDLSKIDSTICLINHIITLIVSIGGLILVVIRLYKIIKGKNAMKNTIDKEERFITKNEYKQSPSTKDKYED
jgi:hypothetical protein